mmetsp:Transcript_12310/g.33207  ORF Transcript_12310/g.33207 Transcript_12310/m.33207 type:complete len:217 (+) Transcript_12310:2364-3014(+)
MLPKLPSTCMRQTTSPSLTSEPSTNTSSSLDAVGALRSCVACGLEPRQTSKTPRGSETRSSSSKSTHPLLRCVTLAGRREAPIELKRRCPATASPPKETAALLHAALRSCSAKRRPAKRRATRAAERQLLAQRARHLQPPRERAPMPRASVAPRALSGCGTLACPLSLAMNVGRCEEYWPDARQGPRLNEAAANMTRRAAAATRGKVPALTCRPAS